MRVLGMAPETINAMFKGYSADLIAYPKSGGRLRLKRPFGFRDTGGGDTSFGNGFVMGTSSLFAVNRAITKGAFDPLRSADTDANATVFFEALLEGFKHLGFKMTGDWSWQLSQMEFLKGAFFLTSAGYLWTLLPSRTIKAGKTTKLPSKMYPLKGVPKQDRMRLGSLMFLYDQAVQVNSYPAVPILRAFAKRHLSLASHPLVLQHGIRRAHNSWSSLLGNYKPIGWASSVPQIDEQSLMDFMATRYGLSAAEVRSIERMYEEHPDEPFLFIEHPAFELMARRDYG
jgi:hypothetical protein